MPTPAERATAALYDQLVARRAEALLGLMDDTDYAASESASFRRAAARIRAMTPDDRAVIADVIRRAAADTLLDILGLINGNYGIDGFDGAWSLCLDGEDVGGEVLDTVLKLEDVAS